MIKENLALTPGYIHLNLQKGYPSGMLVNRKFRWVVQIFKDRKAIKRSQFVKLSRRPDFQPDCNNPHLTDLNYFFDLEVYYPNSDNSEDCLKEDLNDFDEMILVLFDGCGWPLERWVLGSISKIEVASDDLNDNINLRFCCALHEYANLVDMKLPDVLQA